MKNAFVIMPIGNPDSEDGRRFKTVYKYIRSALMDSGFRVVRADEVQQSGAITRDIIQRLSSADLVIADLTDLNPNVFYELGVRHVLRGTGTIMILDESNEKSKIPFDLSAYRVLKFKASLDGIEDLQTGLKSFAEGNEQLLTATGRDNPVHDWLPILPLDLLKSQSGDEQSEYLDRIKDVEGRLRKYQDTFGILPEVQLTNDSPLNTISNIIRDAEDGLLPITIFNTLRVHTEKNDTVSFLKTLKRMIERRVSLDASFILSISQFCVNLGLKTAQKPLLQYALSMEPNNTVLQSSYYTVLVSSPLADDRQQARVAMLANEHIQLKDQKAAGITSSLNILRFVIILDAFFIDGLHQDSLLLTTAAISVIPNDSKLLRNHARSLGAIGQHDQALAFYKRAVLASNVDSLSTSWLAVALKDSGDLVGALEVRALSCTLDPDEANHFLQVMFSIGEQIKDRKLLENNAEAFKNVIQAFASCAWSCSTKPVNILELIAISSKESGLDLVSGLESVDRESRLKTALSFYQLVATDLTRGT